MVQQYDQPVEIKVSGLLACFTRPEMKVERVSYPVMTPTAALGLLANVFWKPEFSWQLQEIVVLKEIEYQAIARNEVKSRASARTAQGWERAGTGGYSAESDHTPRNTLALRNVAYVIRALPVPFNPETDAAKYRDQFRRRVRNGQCFAPPFLGCREFVARFEEPTEADRAIDLDMEIGRMLHSIVPVPGAEDIKRPRFFNASVKNGVLAIPQEPE